MIWKTRGGMIAVTTDIISTTRNGVDAIEVRKGFVINTLTLKVIKGQRWEEGRHETSIGTCGDPGLDLFKWMDPINGCPLVKLLG